MIKATIKHVASFSLMMLLTVGFAVSTYAQITYGENVVLDGDFSGDTLSAKWATEINATGTISVINGELAFTGMGETANQYDIQANQPFSAEQIAELAKGGTFELTFDARTTADSKQFHVFLGEVGGSWARYWESPGNGDVTVTNSTQTYTLTTDIEATWDAMRLGFEVSTDTSSLYIDNVVLRKVTENILIAGDFSGDTLSTSWTQVTDDASAATFAVVDGELAITDITSTGTSFHIQAFQNFNQEQLDSIYVGPYEISFDARTDADEKNFVLYFGENVVDGNWTNFASGASPTITSSMATYTYSVDVTDTWESMKLGFEIGADASSVYLDNVVLKRVREIAPEAPAFSLSDAGGVVTITVEATEGAFNYDIYFNDTAIDSLTQPGVTLIGTVDSETGLSLDHTTTAPHVSLVSEFTAYYAVVAKSEKGSASPETTDSIETEMSVAENYAAELSTEAVDAVFEAIAADAIPEASILAGFFPEGYVPFTIAGDSKVVENGTGGDSDEDISSKYWIGFDAVDNTLIVYAEVTDDIKVFAPAATTSGGAWDFDSWEMGLANYEPASFVQGSDHQDFEGGDEPDWQLRGGLMSDRGPFIHANGGGNMFSDEVPNSETIGEETDTGYRTLTVVSMIELSGGVSMDKAFDFPTGEEIGLYPFNVTINDNDATSRDTQIGWSPKGGDDTWWNTPAKWIVIAFVGADAPLVSNEGDLTSPDVFALDQNYPNPFNPSTNINFSLATNTEVTLEVFNMLGQKVATLLQNERMTSGQHSQKFNASSLSSGMYVYRLSTSSFVQSRKMMLIK